MIEYNKTILQCFEEAGRKFPFDIEWLAYPGVKITILSDCHKDDPTFKCWYYETHNFIPGDLFTYNTDHTFKLFKENNNSEKLYTLTEIITITEGKVPFEIQVVKEPFDGLTRWGRGSGKNKIGEVSKIVKYENGVIFNEFGVNVDVYSPQGLNKVWKLVNFDNNKKLEQTKITEFKLTEEQTQKIKKDHEYYQCLSLENTIRVAIFSRTMCSVKNEDVKKIVEVIYKDYKNKKVTKSQLMKLINQTCDKIIGQLVN